MRLKKPNFWDRRRISIWAIVLFPLSIIFLLSVWLSKVSSIFKTHNHSLPIICIGNIYVGGTGKTPLAVEIFKFLKSDGKKPSFIKKHYDFLIDEIRMLRKIGDTFHAKKRSLAIRLSELNGNDVAILDDGFQDFSIKPNFSILCFNSKQLIGNGLIIPSGPLRERLNAVSRADCIIINGDRTKETLAFEDEITKIIPEKKMHFFYSKYSIDNIENLRNKKITAFAGIGNPSNFFNLLKESKLDVKKTFSFPDHHKYSQSDFDQIIYDKSNEIFTTKKDYFRLNDKQREICNYVEINLEIENKDKLESLIRNAL